MADAFSATGPDLPIEFSRVSTDGRVTLVIDPDAAPIRTYCVRLEVVDLDQAIQELALREKIAEAREAEWVGVATRDDPTRNTGDTVEEVRSTISRWLLDQPLDAVLWTALPARAPDGRFEKPSPDSLVAHLESLSGHARSRAEEYIRRAPEAVRTRNRKRFEEVFGWSAIDAPDGVPKRESSDG